jgi:putative endonuclease
VVEGARLESVYRGNSIEGSNPSVSALPSVALAKEGFSKTLPLVEQIVYILLCNDGSYYTGCTNNLEERLIRHQNGYVDSTKNKLPVKLVSSCAFIDKTKAFEFEKYLKTGSGIAFRNKHLI